MIMALPVIKTGWSGGAKVLCILDHRGVQLILAYSWARPAILVGVRVEGECFYFFCFFTFIPVPLSSLSLSFISSTLSSISFLPFSGRRHKMTLKGWRVVKPQHNQIFLWSKRMYPFNIMQSAFRYHLLSPHGGIKQCLASQRHIRSGSPLFAFVQILDSMLILIRYKLTFLQANCGNPDPLWVYIVCLRPKLDSKLILARNKTFLQGNCGDPIRRR